MTKLDENILRQLNKIKISFLKYYPVRIKNVGTEEQTARQIIWDFKDGKAFEKVAQMAAYHLNEQFGEQVKNIVFCCVPASSPEKNEIRYKDFSERVCELSGAINGYNHIQVLSERPTVHEHRKDKEKNMVQVINFDEVFFKNKSCLLFDDIITKGISYSTFANLLEQFGANVLGGFFLGKTYYKIR